MNRRRNFARLPIARAAFTLLEVLLALGLSVVVLAIVVSAIQLNLQMLDERRSRVEQVQLAHAVLQKIAGDLRSTLSRQNPDMSALESMSAGGMGDLGSLTGELPEGELPEGELPGGELPDDVPDPTGEGTGGEATAGDDDMAALADALAGGTGTPEEEAPTTSTPPGPPPGIYGGTSEIQVDVSRLPRVDEFAGTWDAETGVAAPPSDVKTVTYFLLESTGDEEAAIGETPRYGLMRHEMGRAAAQYRLESGASVRVDEESEPLCPEVEFVEFRYFDGTSWLSEWDTETSQGLPRAVEVSIRLRDDSDVAAGEVADDELSRTYRMVVQVPLAANNAAFEDAAATADETAPDAPDAPADSETEPPPTGGETGETS